MEDEGALKANAPAAFDATLTRFSPEEAVALTRYRADAATLAAFKSEVDQRARGREGGDYRAFLNAVAGKISGDTSDFGPLSPDDPLRKNLVDEERVAIWIYSTDNIYDAMNGALRKSSTLCREAHPRACPAAAFEALRPYANTIKVLSSALNKLPPSQEAVVHRGTKAEYLSAYQKSATVVEAPFLSTSANGSVPEDFRGTGTMQITHKTCPLIGLLSEKPYEGEVLCPPGTKLRVDRRDTRIEKVDGKDVTNVTVAVTRVE